MKSVSKCILVGVFLILAAAFASAQTFTHFNPPPCDFSNQFYADNGLVSAATNPPVSNPELDTEPDGRFGTFRKTGPPATGSQVNWVADTTDCSATDPDRRDFRILATTAGNADDGNSPFSCFDGAPSPGSTGAGQFGPNAVFPQCANQPGANPPGPAPESLEFISILAFIHTSNAFETNDSRNVGFINGGLQGVQQNDGTNISMTPGTDFDGRSTGINPRGISQEEIVSNFEAYGAVKQFVNGVFAGNPCAADMQSPLAPATPCFPVADTIVNGSTLSNVATPNLRQNWRFATNRNAMDGSDGNCINNTDQNCKHKVFADAPFGYFCDDLLGMWIITYFWFTKPPNTTDPVCAPVFAAIGAKNGFNLDGTPVILTAHELNDELEANGCGAEGKEQPTGVDGGAVWLVCPAIPDPRNGAIASDAFLDVTLHNTSSLDTFIQNNFTCLQQTGKFCFDTSVE